jgi:hypothetical protein
MATKTVWADRDLLRKTPLQKAGNTLVRVVRIADMVHVRPKTESTAEQLDLF